MFVHSSRIKTQIEHLRSKGIPVDPIYSLAEINREDVLNSQKTFSFEQYHTVLEYAIDQTGDDYYGLRMGQEPHIAGTIGMMCASCSNLKQAFMEGCKYFKVQGNFAEIRFIDDSRFPYIRYTLTNAWRMLHPITSRHEVDTMFSFLSVILAVNSNHRLKPHRVRLIREAPPDNKEYEKVFGITPEYDQEENEMIFSARDLMIPMKAFNPETFDLLRSYIEFQLRRFKNEESVSEKVRNILLSSIQYSFPDIETVAAELSLSSRTLQRMLSGEKTSFTALLQETRFDLARQMLKQKDLTVSEISFMLGYSDIGNFSRSFKKYTGISPAEFRLGSVEKKYEHSSKG